MSYNTLDFTTTKRCRIAVSPHNKVFLYIVDNLVHTLHDTLTTSGLLPLFARTIVVRTTNELAS